MIRLRIHSSHTPLEHFIFEIVYSNESRRKREVPAYPQKSNSQKGFPKGHVPLAAGGIYDSQATSNVAVSSSKCNTQSLGIGVF